MSHKPDLSIVVLNYKMGGLVKNCLKSIFEHPTEKSIEVIVVDNNSQDDCEELLQKHHPDVKYIQSGANHGHAKGNNIGIKESNGRYVMIINPDVVFLNPTFDQLIDFLDSQPEIGMTTVQLQNPDGSLQPGAWRFLTLLTPVFQRNSYLQKTTFGKNHINHFMMNEWDRTTSREVDWVQGSCLTVRREALDEIGLLDERFFLYFTDVDWCRRCWEAGWKVYYYTGVNAIHYYHRESAHKQGLRSITSKATRIHIKDWIKYLHKYKAKSHPQKS